jgi:hypothetical protein
MINQAPERLGTPKTKQVLASSITGQMGSSIVPTPDVAPVATEPTD